MESERSRPPGAGDGFLLGGTTPTLPMPHRETKILRQIDVPAHVVYDLLLDPQAISAWKVPDGMTCRVHTFEPHTGGVFRVSLTYVEPGSLQDNELGWSMALGKLALLAKARTGRSGNATDADP